MDLSGNQLDRINDFPQRLQELRLSNNLFSTIPPVIQRLTMLTKIDISHNRLVDISRLASLTTLQEIHADHNRISKIGSLHKIGSLQILDLSFNEIDRENEISHFFYHHRVHLMILTQNPIGAKNLYLISKRHCSLSLA
jgi:internalin A